MRKYLFSLFTLSLFLLPTTIYPQDVYKETRAHVGDIPFVPQTDNPNFLVKDFDNALPYNTYRGFHIEGDRYRVLKYFAEKYKQESIKDQTGYITIRFLVNFKGETDRFRVYEMDKDYQPMSFDSGITLRLLQLTKQLDGWKTVPKKGSADNYDYYQYILFKMKDGQIETILP